MLAGHSWERDFMGYKCVLLPLEGTQGLQWCGGCGCRISDREIRESGYPADGGGLCLSRYLNTLASGKGYEPIESRTNFVLKGETMKKVYKCMYCGVEFTEKDIPPALPKTLKYSIRTRPMCLRCYPKVDY